MDRKGLVKEIQTLKKLLASLKKITIRKIYFSIVCSNYKNSYKEFQMNLNFKKIFRKMIKKKNRYIKTKIQIQSIKIINKLKKNEPRGMRTISIVWKKQKILLFLIILEINL